ncbi:hypothetical protein ACG94X_15470 [Acinetobacter sp. ULE_I010]|uniref:hypothetical protein n=1 Tax=Acinetobacter sp. ULE_I010 TaxID=3373065 RepID=UPI003AF52C1B
MKEDIKKTLINTFGRISYLAMIFFFLTFILFTHNDVNDPLKESWTAGISFLSVLSTLGAAYIASKLFIDWKHLHNKQSYTSFALKIKSDSEFLEDNLILTTYELEQISFLVNTQNFNQSEASLILRNIKRDMWMSYKALVSSSQNLQYVFEEAIDPIKLKKFEDDGIQAMDETPNEQSNVFQAQIDLLNKNVSDLVNIHDEYHSEIVKITKNIKAP